MEGKTATLINSYKGYNRIELIKKESLKWEVKIIGPGIRLYLYEDEFIVDE
jgi:hypothetical protein